jgi:hypothetical protein
MGELTDRDVLQMVADGFDSFYRGGQNGLHDLLNCERFVRAALADVRLSSVVAPKRPTDEEKP